MKKFLYTVIALLVLSGCASQPYKTHVYKSEAWNVTRAAGAEYIEDIPADEINKTDSVNEEGNKDGLGWFLFNTAIGGFHHSVPLAIVSKEARKEMTSSIIGWMPVDMANTKDEALKKYQDIIAKASAKALSEVSWPSYIKKTYIKDNIHYFEYKKEGAAVFGSLGKGDKCIKEGFHLPGYYQIEKTVFSYLTNNENQDIGKTRTIGRWYDINIKKVPSPDFLGETYDAWFPVGYDRSMGFVIPESVMQASTNLPTYDYYLKVSQYLPDWMYIYVAPKSKYSSGLSKKTENGLGRPVNIPVVFNQGEEKFFIVPEGQ